MAAENEWGDRAYAAVGNRLSPRSLLNDRRMLPIISPNLCEGQPPHGHVSPTRNPENGSLIVVKGVVIRVF